MRPWQELKDQPRCEAWRGVAWRLEPTPRQLVSAHFGERMSGGRSDAATARAGAVSPPEEAHPIEPPDPEDPASDRIRTVSGPSSRRARVESRSSTDGALR
jgi:hypothetical protein